MINNDVIYCNSIPAKCTKDGTRLLHTLVVIGHTEQSGCKCQKCERIYLQKATQNSPIKTANKNDSEEHISLKLPREIINPPESTIVLAQIKQGNKKSLVGYIAITSDYTTQDSQRGVYWVGRTLPSKIIAAIRIGHGREFIHDGIVYRVSHYDKMKGFQKYYEIFGRFLNPSCPQTVYVFKQKMIYNFEDNRYENVTAMIPCNNCDYLVPVNVYYDSLSHQYFINEATYNQIRCQYGIPYLRIVPATPVDCANRYESFREQSELRIYGYSVSEASGLTTDQRRQLLTSLMNAGLMEKAEIINHLEWLIHFQENVSGKENAVAEWESDLRFVNQYKIDKQCIIFSSSLICKASNQTYGVTAK